MLEPVADNGGQRHPDDTNAEEVAPVTARRPRRGLGRRIARAVMITLLALVLAPPVLTVLYMLIPPVSTLMLGRTVQGLWVDRQWRTLDEISPNLVRAVITSEDSGFCSHNGVDWEALEGQIERLNAGKEARGASTITMQLAKNLFLWGDRSFVRKGMELPLALMLDAMLSKRRIMELYLNIAEWGEGIFGAEAAAQAWFGKPAAALTTAEAARLATALPNPILRNPAKPGRGHARLASTNQSRVTQAGDIFSCVLTRP
ncbi:monofunctional biosynthetic peptidoglycan transglycosylase [Microvirga tunisiensis]|uniref:Biosynthetic peptidoglycan transglycosylase n=1 Tax=Pannonibacter tanglangensis TaxID=2750084 RepID=A0A7X5JAA6_9HYPH|nr:monofunctional biosynthetic peptidoglycan transglycosylase [Pannonibacter sp. XCT-53]NBN80327.1 monofunctional biosynthetic peptidoglycan transglycosylase [Pannonibacter sp. XCT-53]